MELEHEQLFLLGAVRHHRVQLLLCARLRDRRGSSVLLGLRRDMRDPAALQRPDPRREPVPGRGHDLHGQPAQRQHRKLLAVDERVYELAGRHPSRHAPGAGGADFDIKIERWSSSDNAWSTKLASDGGTDSESLHYFFGDAGRTYRWKIQRYGGSGNYTFCLKRL